MKINEDEMKRCGSISARVLSVLKDSLSIDEVEPHMHFTHDLLADSLDKVLIVMALEDEFDLALEDEDFDDICTVQQVIDHMIRVA